MFKLNHVLVVLHLAWMHSFPFLSRITRSGLAPSPALQNSSGIVPNVYLPCLVVSFNMCQGLKCSTCSFNTEFEYVINIRQWRPIFGGKVNFKIRILAVFSKKDTYSQQRSLVDQRSPAGYLPGLVFLCCLYLDSYFTCLFVALKSQRQIFDFLIFDACLWS